MGSYPPRDEESIERTVDYPSVLELIRNRQLRVALQPIVHLHDGSLLAHEVLVRSTHPEFRSPREIFEVAAASGHCGELGRAIREIAIVMGRDHALFLNIHPNELHDGLLLDLADPIYRHPHDVYLEITESVPLSHFRICQEVLRKIRDRGVRLVIDDLGAGYSNLRYIADLNPSLVKLDRALVKGLSHSQRMRRLVASIVALCENLDAEVVAEGIESIEELTAAREAGVHYAQGFLLARPSLPPPEARWPLEREEGSAPNSGTVTLEVPDLDAVMRTSHVDDLRKPRDSHVEDLKQDPAEESDKGKQAAEE